MAQNLDPAMCVGYGPSGVGKTLDVLYAFPDGVVIAQPGALKGAPEVLGIDPQWYDMQTIQEITEFVKKEKPVAILIDDLSLLIDRCVRQSKLTGFTLWGAILKDMLNLMDCMRANNCFGVFNAHEQIPNPSKGMKGGPKLPGKLAHDVPAKCDLVLRAIEEKERLGWPFAYQCNQKDPAYTTKDRHARTPDIAPMNLAEILRNCGYTVPYAKGLEWMGDVVDKITSHMLRDGIVERAARIELFKVYIPQIAAKYSGDPRHHRWVLRDVIDRVDLRNAMGSPLKLFGL